MYLFKQTETDGVYESVRNVQQGLGPLIWELIAAKAREANPSEGQGFPWRISDVELIDRLLHEPEKSDRHRYKLIADVQNVLGKPDRKCAQLFELTKMLGYSGWNWTPMMWKLRWLIELEDCSEARTRNRWEFEPADDYVYEFLRLQADHNWERTRLGSRGFGMVGGFNGVLLWPEAFDFFLREFEADRSHGEADAQKTS